MPHWMKSLLVASFMLGLPAVAQETEVTPTSLLKAIKSKDWSQVNIIVQDLSNPSAETLSTWARLREGGAAWAEYRNFLAQNPHWPGLARLRVQAERAIDGSAKNSDIENLFANRTPRTAIGALALAKIDPSTIIESWENLNLNEAEQQLFLTKYGTELRESHKDRLENLLWRGAITQASKMLPLVSEEQQKSANLRIEMQSGVLPESIENLADGLAYDYFQHLITQGKWDAAQNAIVAVTSADHKMGRPEKWAKRRRGFARRAMRAGDVQTAYDLARFHGLSSGANYADLEWLSGYISLHHLNKPEQALVHFKKFKAAVTSPISRGRASFWLGQTYEALTQYEQAAANYREGAQHQTSFYGQLATQRNRSKADPTLAGADRIGDWRTAAFVDNSVFQASQILHAAGETTMTRWFLAHMAETLPQDQLILLADYSREIGADFSTVSIAKEAVKRGIVIPAAYFPVTELAKFAEAIPPELAMSIARRESELNPLANSPAGARGLMQIMPATAREVAKELGIDYDKQKLTQNWEYNATLGTAYLGGLIEKYNGSYVLAIAAYNAGPHRVAEWIETYGDPRKTDTDVIHWIEHIPYRETRNYVMRVMESLHVYRARIAGKTLPLRIYQDLSR